MAYTVFRSDLLSGTDVAADLVSARVYDSGETVYYGVVRPSWLGNRNQSGFTISCLGHGGEKQNMAMFMNSYSNISL